jgi:hypothetical protein
MNGFVFTKTTGRWIFLGKEGWRSYHNMFEVALPSLGNIMLGLDSAVEVLGWCSSSRA